jgi:iron complex transport system substrate-binding protein
MRRWFIPLLMVLPVMAQAAPKHIVSMNPCADAILLQVANPEQVAAISHYSRDLRSSSIPLAQAKRFSVTYGAAEEVIALKPDMVIVSSFTPLATRAIFAQLGIKIVVFGMVSTVDENYAQVREIAALAGHPVRGEQLIGRIKNTIRAAKSDKKPLTALVRTNSGLVLGEGTLIHAVMRESGFTNHSAALGLGISDTLPLEPLLLNSPQIIFTVGEQPHHPIFSRLQKHTALRAMPNNLINCGGPSLIEVARFFSAARKSLP